MKCYTLSLGQTIDYAHQHPERTACKSGHGTFSDYTFQVWSNRKALARSVRMQERRGHEPTDWRPLVPLTDGEGF